ncbi:TRAP transporter small permease [Butyricicoccus faecihominis]|uniref:TRAP transporter small permease n=1 Tax=Butyricicoccaceae TaxID=3085642 RepID=UPI00247941EC|nr:MULTISPECIES: TRAP transporter small permease [Butyricicoccaceae]MCQ5131102.1 TRAP transporter small permease [Butyricicoccus faecihominis]WNX84128.1 TRAP transporter small permease [Agathobaculum sp. NTUH-O15-33]
MKAIKWLNRHAEEVLLVAMLVVMLVVEIAQIFMRRVMGSSLSWAEEVVRYLFVWSGFLSISFTIQNQSAMRLTMLVAAMPRMVRHICIAVVYIALTAFFGYMAAVAVVQLGSMHQTSAALGMPMVYVYLAPVVGFILTTVRSIQALIVVFKGLGKNHTHDIVINTKPEEGGTV